MTLSWQGLAILAGAFLAVSGLIIWLLERRKGRPIGLAMLVGLPGLYMTGLPFFGAPKWLFAPGIPLLAAGYLVQLRDARR